MNEEYIVNQLREMRCPCQVNVVEQVMSQVSKRPMLTPISMRRRILRVSTIAAAAFVGLSLAINLTIMFTRSYDEGQIGNMISEVYDYHADYGTQTISADHSSHDLADYLAVL